MSLILAINPGSTSTKVAVYENEKKLLAESLDHPLKTLAQFPEISAQQDFRKEAIVSLINEAGYSCHDMDAVVGRGGLLKPMPGGVYRVCQQMLTDLREERFGVHACNLGAILADDIATEGGAQAFIVDPPVVDEFADVARVTGHPGIMRKSKFHALNHKAIGRRCAAELGHRYDEVRLVVAHLGGGITVAAHDLGRVVDANDGLDAEGPMTPERAGTLPAGDLASLCFSGEHSHEEVKWMLTSGGGLVAHLGTNDLREVKKMIAAGNKEANLSFRAMAYQVAKEVGACACALSGSVDAIALTGGMAHDEEFVELIRSRVEWIAPVKVYAGEDELLSLTTGALRVLQGAEVAKDYLHDLSD